MKFLVLIVVTLFRVQSGFADCDGPRSPLGGKFEVLEKSDAFVSCEAGQLKIAGCVLKLRMLEPPSNRLEVISVYGKLEACNLKLNKVVELRVDSVCCGMRYSVPCSDGKGGVSTRTIDIGEASCMAKTRFYVQQYQSLRGGKSVIRNYNHEVESFENSLEKKIIVPKPTYWQFNGGEMLRRPEGGAIRKQKTGD